MESLEESMSDPVGDNAAIVRYFSSKEGFGGKGSLGEGVDRMVGGTTEVSHRSVVF